MTKKKYPNLTKSEALILAWKNRKDYKGYDRSKGSSFNSWRSIIDTNKGKLIGYPKEWRDYNVFMSEVQGNWAKGKVCRRYDITKPYSKENCFWADKGTENLWNLNKLIYNGEEKTLLEWCKIYNLNYNGVKIRYYRKEKYKTPEEILFGKKREIKSKSRLKRERSIVRRVQAYRLRDKQKGLKNDLELNWVREFVKQPCIYCGDTEDIGLDRIDNTKGHTKDNVVPCCYTCNTARSKNFTHEEMKILGKTIREIKKCRQSKNQN